MDIADVLILIVFIPADIVLFSVLIMGVIQFRKSTYDLEKMITKNSKNKKS